METSAAVLVDRSLLTSGIPYRVSSTARSASDSHTAQSTGSSEWWYPTYCCYQSAFDGCSEEDSLIKNAKHIPQQGLTSNYNPEQFATPCWKRRTKWLTIPSHIRSNLRPNPSFPPNALWPLLQMIMRRRSGPETNLEQSDNVVLFPSLAHRTPDGSAWQVQVHGEVFSIGKVGLTKRFLLSLLKRAMGACEAEFQGETFQRRISRFVANDGGGKRVAVAVGDETHLLPKSSRSNGHFLGTIVLSDAEIAQLAESGYVRNGLLELGIRSAAGERAPFQGRVHLVEQQGLSIISDIDDTLKHSEVLSRQTLLRNTFLNTFQSVEGMSAVLKRWEQEGAQFHYVSSSPWQLFSHLQELFLQEGFPQGSFHLRAFRLRDHLIRRILMLRRSGKGAVIRNIISVFPQRKFVLIGDSGEHDPEIYAQMARKFPDQITKILIRDLGGKNSTPARFQYLERYLKPGVFQLYKHANELPDLSSLQQW